MEATTNLRHVHIFGDESSHDGTNEFMVYGTMTCEERWLDEVRRTLKFPDFLHEFHWSESDRRLRQHQEFVAAIFKLINGNKLRFRCIIVKTSHMRHREYNQSDADLGLEKYIYAQLLQYALDYLTDAGRFHVVLDEGRGHKYPPEQKQRMLNAGFRKQSRFKHDPFVSVTTVTSESSRLVQAADVLTGAVAWVRNKRYKNVSNSGRKKEQLVIDVGRLARPRVTHKDAIARGLERGDYLVLHYPTYRFADSHGFTLWNFDLTAERRRELQEISRLQLAALPDFRFHFGELPGRGYEIRLECPYCNDVVANDPPDEKFNRFTVNARYRPKCSECWNPRIALLYPDPRDGGLLAGMKARF